MIQLNYSLHTSKSVELAELNQLHALGPAYLSTAQSVSSVEVMPTMPAAS